MWTEKQIEKQLDMYNVFDWYTPEQFTHDLQEVQKQCEELQEDIMMETVIARRMNLSHAE